MYPLVSIIIPVYNDARKFLTETLGSVSAQTRTNWECICVEDGCTDESQEMIAEQIRKDARFRMVCQPNSRLNSGRPYRSIVEIFWKRCHLPRPA